MSNYIAVADLHIQASTAREPEYLDIALKKLKWLEELRREYHATLIVAGDLFHSSQQPPSVINRLIGFSQRALLIAGNHDLPYSSMDFVKDSAYATLIQCNLGVLTHSMSGVPFEFTDDTIELLNWGSNPSGEDVTIQVTHRDLWMSPYAPGQKPGMALEYLKAQNARVVVSGHNHQSFCIEHNGRFLVNCGCMMHSKSREADYKFKAWVIEISGVHIRIFPVTCPVDDVVERAAKRTQTNSYMGDFIEGLSSFSTQKDIREMFVDGASKLHADACDYVRSVSNAVGR